MKRMAKFAVAACVFIGIGFVAIWAYSLYLNRNPDKVDLAAGGWSKFISFTTSNDVKIVIYVRNVSGAANKSCDRFTNPIEVVVQRYGVPLFPMIKNSPKIKTLSAIMLPVPCPDIQNLVSVRYIEENRFGTSFFDSVGEYHFFKWDIGEYYSNFTGKYMWWPNSFCRKYLKNSFFHCLLPAITVNMQCALSRNECNEKDVEIGCSNCESIGGAVTMTNYLLKSTFDIMFLDDDWGAKDIEFHLLDNREMYLK